MSLSVVLTAESSQLGANLALLLWLGKIVSEESGNVSLSDCVFVYSSSRNIPEMTDSCDQEHDGNGDESPSDDDSLSLLRNLSAAHSSGGADEDMEVNNLNSQFVNKMPEKEVAMEINPLKPPESGISSGAQSAAGRAYSTTQSSSCKLETTKTSIYSSV